ncbi:Ca-activated chloride channel family protein OS=Bosea thiooxidans OX=53254 GN=ARD30_11830 PE=4 SV=1 [Bosea thiooxidans]
MLSFAYPWIGLLAPLPLLVWYVLPAHAERHAGLRVPFFDRLARLSGQQPYSGGVVARRHLGRLLLLALAWLMTLAALARPQWIEPPLHRDVPTRDLLVLLISPARWIPRTSSTPPAKPSTG